MNAGFEHMFCECVKYRVTGYAGVTVATFLTLSPAIRFIQLHPSAYFYRKKVFNDRYVNGKLSGSTLVFVEPECL